MREHFRDSSDAGGNYLEATGGGFDDGHAVRFGEGRVQEDVTLGEDVPDLGMFEAAEHRYAVLHVVLFADFLEEGTLGAVTADDEVNVGEVFDLWQYSGEEIDALSID